MNEDVKGTRNSWCWVEGWILFIWIDYFVDGQYFLDGGIHKFRQVCIMEEHLHLLLTALPKLSVKCYPLDVQLVSTVNNKVTPLATRAGKLTLALIIVAIVSIKSQSAVLLLEKEAFILCCCDLWCVRCSKRALHLNKAFLFGCLRIRHQTIRCCRYKLSILFHNQTRVRDVSVRKLDGIPLNGFRLLAPAVIKSCQKCWWAFVEQLFAEAFEISLTTANILAFWGSESANSLKKPVIRTRLSSGSCLDLSWPCCIQAP